MKIKCLNLLKKMETERQRLFEKIEAVDENQLSLIPKPNKWSILQVVYHLLKSEQLSLIYVKKKLFYKSNIFQVSPMTSLRSAALNLGMRLPIKFRAPQRVAEFPEDLNWPDLKKQWDEARIEFDKIFEGLLPEFEDKQLFYHPEAGRMTLYHMLTFFRTHINRHEKQIDKLIKK